MNKALRHFIFFVFLCVDLLICGQNGLSSNAQDEELLTLETEKKMKVEDPQETPEAPLSQPSIPSMFFELFFPSPSEESNKTPPAPVEKEKQERSFWEYYNLTRIFGVSGFVYPF